MSENVWDLQTWQERIFDICWKRERAREEETLMDHRAKCRQLVETHTRNETKTLSALFCSLFWSGSQFCTAENDTTGVTMWVFTWKQTRKQCLVTAVGFTTHKKKVEMITTGKGKRKKK